MAFKRTYDDKFKKNFTVKGETFTCLLAIPTYEDMLQPVSAVRDGRILVGWENDSGIADSETGQPLPYTPENRAAFIQYTPIMGGIIQAASELYGDALSLKLWQGNSSALPATTPVATAPVPSDASA